MPRSWCWPCRGCSWGVGTGVPLCCGMSFKKSRWRFDEFEVGFIGSIKEVLEGPVFCAGDIIRVKFKLFTLFSLAKLAPRRPPAS